ncbi:MAG TPA: SCO family protein [Xanthomonadaceae bacterium]|nr:SCO family protein [Xanthomonadaceae bacterium]
MTAFQRCLTAACALLLALPAFAAAPAQAAPLPRESVYQLPVKLTDAQGRQYDWRSLRGKPRVVSMFYTSCQFICPLIVDAGKAIEKQLTPAQQQRVGFLLVSMDPARDTPAALKKIETARKLDPKRWTLASPAPGDVRAVAGVLGVRYRQLEDGEFNHSTVLVLLDADGRELARTEQVGSKTDPEFLAAVRKATGT